MRTLFWYLLVLFPIYVKTSTHKGRVFHPSKNNLPLNHPSFYGSKSTCQTKLWPFWGLYGTKDVSIISYFNVFLSRKKYDGKRSWRHNSCGSSTNATVNSTWNRFLCSGTKMSSELFKEWLVYNTHVSYFIVNFANKAKIERRPFEEEILLGECFM